MGSSKSWQDLSYGKRLLIAFDQLVNTILFGWPDETLSSRCYRLRLAGKTWPEKVVNTIFFWEKNHCEESYNSEVLGRQLPQSLRKQ